MRTYSLFRKIGPRKYQRLSPCAFSLNTARRAFQGALLDGSFAGFAMYLRPAATLMPSDAEFTMVENAIAAFRQQIGRTS